MNRTLTTERINFMNTLLPEIADIEALFLSGKVAEAKGACLALIENNPHEINALHLMGLMVAEEGDWQSATAYLRKANRIERDNPMLALHLASALKATGALAAAKAILTEVIDANPHFAPAYNNLGAIYFSEQQWNDAVAAYHAAIDERPDYLDAYYNLGLALTKLGRHEEALNVYQALLQIAGEHVGASFQIACLLMLQKKIEEALQSFLQLETQYPFHFETQTNLATCYLYLGQFSEAKLHYLKANEINSADEQVAYNLGVMNMQQGFLDEAISFYLQVLKINPYAFAAHNNLGVAYLAKRNTAAALMHFCAASKLEPANEALSHVIAMLSAKKGLAFAPIGYVRSLFDSYAGHYDAHLQSVLNYNVPNLIFAALNPFLTDERLLVLDLGCGTGLCGERLKSISHKLVGVDVAEKMLAVARQKLIYDELILADITEFLSDQSASYDLIVAGDVLVYVGDLSAIFAAVARTLKPHGYFVLTTEQSVMEDYYLGPTGRFAHQKTYIDRLADKNRFEVLQYHVAPLRKERDEPLMGQIYVLQKRSLLASG